MDEVVVWTNAFYERIVKVGVDFSLSFSPFLCFSVRPQLSACLNSNTTLSLLSPPLSSPLARQAEPRQQAGRGRRLPPRGPDRLRRRRRREERRRRPRRGKPGCTRCCGGGCGGGCHQGKNHLFLLLLLLLFALKLSHHTVPHKSSEAVRSTRHADLADLLNQLPLTLEEALRRKKEFIAGT